MSGVKDGEVVQEKKKKSRKTVKSQEEVLKEIEKKLKKMKLEDGKLGGVAKRSGPCGGCDLIDTPWMGNPRPIK